MSSVLASEASCAPNVACEASMNNMFESGLNLPPPPPLSLSEAAPYSPLGTCRPPEVSPYSPTGSYPPLVLSPARFPPPPNSCFSQSYHPNMTFFEGQPAPHYSGEAHPPSYDRWSERNVNSAPAYGVDNSSKLVSYWPFPGYNGNQNNSSYSSGKSEAFYPAVSASPQYPLCDSTSKSFASKFSPPSREFNSAVSSPNAVISSTSFASISSPHFSSFPPPNVPSDFPHLSNRFSFNPYASAFYPGKDHPPTFGNCSEDFSAYGDPIPSRISRMASANLHGVDSFHDASSRPMHSPETAPRPIKSTSPSLFSGASATSSNPMIATHSLSPRSTCYGPVCSSEGSGIRESSCDFSLVSSGPFEKPIVQASAPLFNPYNTTATSPLAGKFKSLGIEEDDKILSESGILLYHQHMSPEEWRWKQYEHLYAQGMMDPAGYISRGRRPTYNHFQSVDRAGLSGASGAAGGDINSVFALNVLERSRTQNQSGSSLKLAASALAEMLALNSSGATSSTGQSMMARIASLSAADVPFPVSGALGEAFLLPRRQEGLPDDCCSSSGSVAVQKETSDASVIFKRETHSRVPPVEGSHSRPHSSGLQIPNDRGSADHEDDVSALLNASGQSQNSTNARPSWFLHTAPLVAGAYGVFSGGQNPVNEASGGTAQTASADSTGCGVLQEPNQESGTSQNQNRLFTQSLDVSPSTESGGHRKVTTQPVGALSSEDETSIAGPFRANAFPSGPCISGPFQEVSSNQALVDTSHNAHSPRTSVRTSTSPPISQDPPNGSMSTMANGVAARLLASLNWSSPQASSRMHTPRNQTSGFQSLTTSISNLSKVLLAFDTSALPQCDSAGLQESLQSAILRLSECLLLEQGRLNDRSLARDIVGARPVNESVPEERVSTGESLGVLNMTSGAGATDNSNRSCMKPSEGSLLVEIQPGGRAKEVHSSPEIMNTSSENADLNTTFVEANGFQGTVGSRGNADDSFKNFLMDSSANLGHNDSTGVSEETDSSQLLSGDVKDILDFLRHRDIDLRALKKMVAAEEREERLIVIIEDLKEELEFEREENKGTAFLCERIMQEAEAHTVKVQAEARLAAERANASRDGKSASSLSKTTLSPPPTVLKAQSSSNDLGGVEARLALLRGRQSWDTEIGVFTETEPCTPYKIASSDLNHGREDISGSSSLGIHDERVGFGENSSYLNSQILIQSEVLSNMDAAWSQCYDYLESQELRLESKREVEEKETQKDSAVQAYDNNQSIEARALMIRSRPNWVEVDGVESSSGNFAGSLDHKPSRRDSMSSGSSRNDRFETLNEICLVRLLDADVENPQPALTRKTSPRQPRENELDFLPESLSSDAEAVKNIIQSQDLEEEAGWEHVRLPRQNSE